MSLIFSNLVVPKTLSTIIISMHNFIAKFREILDICKHFAGNHVNDCGNIPRRSVIPKFSDIEMIALSIKAEAFSIDSENYLFQRLNSECPGAIHSFDMTAAKVATFTMLQYFNLLNHRPIGQVKYALF